MNATSITTSATNGAQTQGNQNPHNPENTNEIFAGVKQTLCDDCGKIGTKLCTGCRRIYYCSKACQKAAWVTHQTICKNTSLIPLDSEIVCKYKDSKEGIVDLTQKAFKEKMKAAYVCAPLFSALALQQVRTTTDKPFIHKHHSVSDQIAVEYVSDKIGYGLVALKDIPKGTILTSFGGIAYPADLWDSEKRPNQAQLCCIFFNESLVFDPSQYTSLGAIINEGPPNAEFISISEPSIFSNSTVVPSDKVAIATRLIKEGESIYAEYHPEHAVRKTFYSINEKTLERLIQTHSTCLDISLLNQTGWIFSAVNQSIPADIDVVKLREIQYILTTPYLLAVIHLRTDLQPKNTLENLNKLSNTIYEEYPVPLKNAKIVLNCLTTIPKNKKAAFLDIVERVSQTTLIFVCVTFLNLPDYSIDYFKRVGILVDKLLLLFTGTTIGSFWENSEKAEFKKIFLTHDHQKMIFDDTEIQQLPVELGIIVAAYRNKLYKEISEHLSTDELTKIKPCKDTSVLAQIAERVNAK